MSKQKVFIISSIIMTMFNLVSAQRQSSYLVREKPCLISLDQKVNKTAFSKKFPTKKKKIIIFTSKGGYGHKAACQALKQTLSDRYDLTIINPFQDLLGSIDPLRTITRGRIDGEDMYNSLLRNCWSRSLGIICKYIAPVAMRLRRRSIERNILQYVQEKKPHMIISVIPFLNLPISNVAKKLQVPFLLVTLDGDLTNWVFRLKRMTHTNYVVTIGFQTPKTRKILRQCGINDKRILHTGFPLRADFLEKKDKHKIRQAWHIEDNKFTIMLLMGGAGSKVMYRYVKKIAKFGENIHLIACVGRDKRMLKKLEDMKINKNVTLSVVPFTNRISDLMAISDLLITKSGPGTINEALHMRLPMLIDKTSPPVFWERANIRFVQKNGFGDVVTRFGLLKRLVRKYKNDKAYYQYKKKKLATFSKRYFSRTIKKIVMYMCPPH